MKGYVVSVGDVSVNVPDAAATVPVSDTVMVEFCMTLPVVESNRAIALSVDELGPVTSPVAVARLTAPDPAVIAESGTTNT